VAITAEEPVDHPGRGQILDGLEVEPLAGRRVETVDKDALHPVVVPDDDRLAGGAVYGQRALPLVQPVQRVEREGEERVEVCAVNRKRSGIACQHGDFARSIVHRTHKALRRPEG
jgi:hypothetical protein